MARWRGSPARHRNVAGQKELNAECRISDAGVLRSMGDDGGVAICNGPTRVRYIYIQIQNMQNIQNI